MLNMVDELVYPGFIDDWGGGGGRGGDWQACTKM